MHHHTKRSKTLQELRKEPQTEVDFNMDSPLREIIRKIQISTSSSQSKNWNREGPIKTIYFLFGDERRAIRKFIEKHSTFCESCMESEATSHPINMQLDEFMWELFKQEYEIMQYNGEI